MSQRVFAGCLWLTLCLAGCAEESPTTTDARTELDAAGGGTLDAPVASPEAAVSTDAAAQPEASVDVPFDAPGDAPSSDTPPPQDGGRADDATDSGRPDEILSITVDPPMASVRVTDAATRVTQRFTARGLTRDRRVVPVTALWTLEPTTLATIDATGLATTTNRHGGDGLVTARVGTLAATATLRVVLDLSVTPTGTPAGTPDLFPATGPAAPDAARTPTWVYPANGTVFPQNVSRNLFQWRPAGNDRFRLTFESDRSRVVVFTGGVHPTCTAANTGLSCFEPDAEVWRYLAASNPRGSVRVTVDGARAASPGRFDRSSTLSIGFSRGPVPGAIYYWSTTARGVRRATVEDATPANFLTPPEANGDCVACHTLSRRGNLLAADVGGNNLWVVGVSPTTPPPRLVTQYERRNIPMFWSTFSFDETRVLTAARGVMTLRRASDGGPINTVTLAARTYGTQPDWAPDNTLVAFVSSANDRDRGVQGGRIATLPVLAGDTWGTARTLVGTGANNDTNQFPSFSWDSQWIAYAHSTGNGQNDVTSDLWLVRRDGDGPRAMRRANTAINNGVVTTPTVQDNMPTWAPSGVPDDYAWVAFSSTRDYGGVLSRSSRLGQHEQLWIAAVDLSLAASGSEVDPSFPAFRLPAQELAEDTHRPFWAQDRVRPMCAAEGASCAADGDCCSPLACRGGACRAACAPLSATCATSADCCAPSVCLGGSCRPPCGPPGAACGGAGDCCAPAGCEAGLCVAPPCRVAGTACTTSADCCAPAACVGGVCAPPPCRAVGATCATSADCCSPAACVSGACRLPCVASGGACGSDRDCCAGTTCRGGVCRPPCVASGMACAADGDCCTGTTCRGGSCIPACMPSGGRCASSADCCAPSLCTMGTCGSPCVASGAACVSDTDCCTGTSCRGGSCRPPCLATSTACTGDLDCCSGSCVRGSCAPPPCRVSGGSCTTNADCCSGTCSEGGCAPG